MLIVLSALLGVVILTDAALIVCWLYFDKRPKFKNESVVDRDWPMISVLLAVRNEEYNIKRCLSSLLAQDYPKEKIEILIGDDSSSDDTYSITKTIIQNHSNCHLFKISEQVASQKGKANVLAQLARKATGEYYFVTDADMHLPESWVKEMIIAAGDDVDLVTGTTLVEDNKWQSIDWLFSIAMIYILDRLSKPVTAMGNNMMITKRAYDAVGGYEKIPFSVTEDMELFRHVISIGFKVRHHFDEKVLGFTKSAKGIINLLHQRKRWMRGAIQLKWHMVLLLLIQAMYFPLILTVFFLSPLLGVCFFLIKIVIQALFIKLAAVKLKRSIPFFQLIIYEFYNWFVAVGSGLFYLSGGKVIWKGRKY